jgi:ribonucleoside-triphosphate reductase
MNRLVQDAVKAKKDIKEHLKEQVQRVHKYLYATKQFQIGLMKAGMLDAYTQGFINMDKQFVTLGINGLLESAEFMGLKPGNNDDYKAYTSGLLKVIYDENAKAKEQYKINFNTELVPAENLGVKNYNWDKKDGYVVPANRNCYNSYLYKVEDNDINIIDKFYLHGKNNLQYLDGGSALHMNLGEYATKESYIKLYDLAARIGCSYWTQNVRVTCCKNPDCGYIDKRTLTACPKCGSKNIAYATRIIGYLKMEPNFSEARQEEANKRWYHGVDDPNNVNNLEKGE